jgi:hypothetical protein
MRQMKISYVVAGVFAAAVTFTAVSASAVVQATPATHRVACAATEDSYLTDCHGHRLDYHDGGWYAPGPGPAGWLRFSRVRHFDRCHGTGQVIWQASGGAGALHCKNGKTFLR